MKYIIMAGGNYKDQFEIPKPLLEIDGEKLIERTIRLLKENGIIDIAISTNNPAYDYLGIEILKHENNYIHDNPKTNLTSKGCWLNAYYLMNTPCCYLHGDVYWSEEAIKTIIETEVKDTMFFCIPDRYDGRKGFNIKGREPLGYKVQNNELFNNAVKEMKQMIDEGKFKKDPISWHLYRKINNIKMEYDGFGNSIFNTKGDYIAIDDYTTDIDMPRDIPKIEKMIQIMKGGIKMIKVEVIDDFTLGRYNELKNVVRKSKDEYGRLFIGDVFECTEEMAEYLTGKNHLGRAFVKVIEVIPAKVEEPKKEIVGEKVAEEKPVEKKTTKRTRKSIAKK